MRSAGPVSGLNNGIQDPGVSLRSTTTIGRRLAGLLPLHAELWTRTNASHELVPGPYHSLARIQAYQSSNSYDPLLPRKVCS
ncbi:hypothetical protein BO85DRAFT_445551 [Aspergillus piperis CBS 112811]|uniref:Uncharacterized protein n=1 Tax=Aspergillus piperis CBS 112811 TaxID=1448313 RepID=A0A8G1VTS6_9EURO|nr:hypothetical protein BO85DRAFT_445551 [Aspergillus piperis CBS 112811]RAH62123.1 hypothetical protein BO85DRAFT_445551 [Aspergillus piperis CBS 112811]